VGAALPYIWGILKCNTKPNIVSWITWTLLTGIATSAEIAAHEYIAAIFTGSAMIETLGVVILGLKHGYVKYTNFDIVCQVGAIIGIILWQIFNSPTVGVVASVAIDLVGALPTIRHSWLKPNEETWQTYALSGFGGILALAALTNFNPINSSYAVYIVLVNVLLASLILIRTKTYRTG